MAFDTMTPNREVALPLLQASLRDRGIAVRSVSTSDQDYIRGRKPFPWNVSIMFETDPNKLEMEVARHLCGGRTHIDATYCRERVIEPPAYGRRRR